MENGFLQEVIKGWLISSGPGARGGDSTPWYASFWEFCTRYCDERFGRDWYLSPEQSLLLHAENTVIPTQVVVYSPKGTNHILNLLFGTSIYDLKQSEMPSESDLTTKGGLHLFSAAAALVKVSAAFIQRTPVETQVVLGNIRDASDVLRLLLSGGHSAVAGRLAGAFRRIDRADITEEIVKTMKAAGYDVRETDTLTQGETVSRAQAGVAPIVGRMRAMWQSMRKIVLEHFPAPPGLPRDKDAYLRVVDHIYKSDAYHSLSIEGYTVSEALIERLRRGDWNLESHPDDRALMATSCRLLNLFPTV